MANYIYWQIRLQERKVERDTRKVIKDSLNFTHLKIRNMDKAIISHATLESSIHYSMIVPFLMHISLCYYKYNHVSCFILIPHFILIQYTQTYICIHHPYFSLFSFLTTNVNYFYPIISHLAHLNFS